MKAGELQAGRAFGVTFQHGDEFMASLVGFRRENEVRQGSPFAYTGHRPPYGPKPPASAQILDLTRANLQVTTPGPVKVRNRDQSRVNRARPEFSVGDGELGAMQLKLPDIDLHLACLEDRGVGQVPPGVRSPRRLR
jgi:hypothetical protein